MSEERLILIVEDSITQAVRLQHILESEGFATLHVLSGEAALDSIDRRHPDLIIVDFHLPGLRGDELCRRLHLDVTTRAIPVLMLTAHDSSAAQLHGLESGADDFVAKSEDPEILLLRVHALLRRSRHGTDLLELGRSPFRRAAVLLVDACGAYRHRLALDLAEEGWDLVEASSGREALDRAATAAFDCVLVDSALPDLDGLSVCRTLIERRGDAFAPVVVLMPAPGETAATIARARDAGADDFIGRAVEVSLIRGRLRALLRRRFLLEQNRRIVCEIRQREHETLRARAEAEAAEARAAMAEGLAHANQALEQANARLRDEIERRAKAEREALTAREVAEAANRAKTVFLANMSHELRTPLNAIIGFSELTGSIMPPGDLERYGGFLDNISESAHHLLRVINDILDVSRVEVGKVVLRESEVEIERIASAVARLIDHAVSAKGQSLDFATVGRLPPLRADERLLKQILLNLVSNAVKFTPNGGAIRVTAALESGAMVVTVEDNGVGIAADDIPIVLQPFGQAENAISPKHEGTGLGLPLAKGFMDLHGGSLTLDSTLGHGTRVTLRFPPERTVGTPTAP